MEEHEDHMRKLGDRFLKPDEQRRSYLMSPKVGRQMPPSQTTQRPRVTSKLVG
jgi:hypothetical protein